MMTYDLHSCSPSMTTVDLLFKVNGSQDFQHSVRTAATKRHLHCMTRQSPLVSAVCVNCLQTANLFFVELTHLGHQNQKKLMH